MTCDLFIGESFESFVSPFFLTGYESVGEKVKQRKILLLCIRNRISLSEIDSLKFVFICIKFIVTEGVLRGSGPVRGKER